MAKSRTWKAVILASGQAATALVGLILAAIFSRAFDKPDYATYQQTLLVYKVIAPLLALGLPSALYYFIPGTEDRARGILAENLLLLSLTGLIFSIFLFAGGNVLLAQRFSNPDLEKTLLLFAVYPLVMLPASATTACLMARDKVSWVALFTISTRLAKLVVVLAAVWLVSPTPQAAVGGTVVGGVLILVTGVFLMARSVRGLGGKIEIPGIKAQLAYSIPMGIGVMIGTFHRALDKIIVSLFTVPENFAVYVNGAMEVPFIAVITGSATAVLLPELRLMLKEERKAEALRLWQRAGIKTGVLIIPLVGIFVAAAPDLMAILYSEKYRESHVFFRIYALLLPIRIVIFGAIFQAAGRTNVILKRSVIAMVANLALSVLFATLWGYKMVAVATVVAIYAVAVPYSLWMVGKTLQVKMGEVFPWVQVVRILIPVVLGGMATWAVGKWFPVDLVLLRLGVMLAAYGLIMAILLPRIGLFRVDTGKGVHWKKRIMWTL